MVEEKQSQHMRMVTTDDFSLERHSMRLFPAAKVSHGKNIDPLFPFMANGGHLSVLTLFPFTKNVTPVLLSISHLMEKPLVEKLVGQNFCPSFGSKVRGLLTLASTMRTFARARPAKKERKRGMKMKNMICSTEVRKYGHFNDTVTIYRNDERS